MAWIMAEVALQRAVQVGIKHLRADPQAFNEIFAVYLDPEMIEDYGQDYIDKIRAWFETTKIPVLQGWSMNRDRIPCFAVTLSQDNEDESKAAIGDHFGEETDDTLGVAVSSVIVDVEIIASKQSDYVLWMYYILSYILFKEKRLLERLGCQLHTFGAADYIRNDRYQDENVWTRRVRFKCTTQNTWVDEKKTTPDDVDLRIRYGRIGDPDDDDLV